MRSERHRAADYHAQPRFAGTTALAALRAMFRLGHLSDVHLGAVPRLRLRDFISKRLVGYANWRRNRAHALTADTLDRLVADLKAQAPDHIAVTGDLTNIAMREEFENARRWLEELGPPTR